MNGLIFFYLHGAAARIPEDETAFAARRAQWDFDAIGQWADPAESARHIDWVRQAWDKLEPVFGQTGYINHLSADDPPEKVRASYGTNLERLRQVKAKYDTTNFFRLNPNIAPA
jgi:Berberine and berberine like